MNCINEDKNKISNKNDGDNNILDPNLNIILKGVSENLARDISTTIAGILKIFSHGDSPLDFRRMHRIIITDDFDNELAEIAKSTTSKNQIKYTNNEFAMTIAKIFLLPYGSGIEIVPVMRAQVASKLISEDSQQNNNFHTVLHLFHHEFCHVHDENKKIDAFPEIILKQNYVGKEQYIRPISEICWSEYIANRLSSSTAPRSLVNSMIVSFANAITHVKPSITAEIQNYRRHSNLEQLLVHVQNQVNFLIKMASYIIGYIDGLGIPLQELSAETEEKIVSSYFKPTWVEMRNTFTKMFEAYPKHWKNISIYDELLFVIEKFYAEMGLLFLNLPDGSVYIKVP